MGVTLTTEMINGAIQTQNKYGVPASVTLAQIIQESGGSYPGGLSGLAYNHNNLFGIKDSSSWDGQTVVMNTTEYKNGNTVVVPATFRSYNSVADSIDDHGMLLTKSIYTDKTKNATDLESYVRAMGSVYATDPNYADELLKVINDNNLTQYDNGNYTVYSSTATQIDSDRSWWQDILFNIAKFLLLVFICVLAVVFFMGAFDIKIPSKEDFEKAEMLLGTTEQRTNPLITEYGTIPDVYESADDYPFVLFDNNGNFIGAHTSFLDTANAYNNDGALHLAKAYMSKANYWNGENYGDSPVSAYIVLRTDYTMTADE